MRGKQFHLILMPTEKCNFRCVYCYESFVIPKMLQNTVNKVKKYMDSLFEEGYRLVIEFFGGEPMVAYDVVTDLLMHARGRDYEGMMTTNGYLLSKDKFVNLVNLGVTRYQITFDGEERFHDRVRPTVGGMGTFNVILSNLRSAMKTDLDFEILVRMHLHGGQANSIKSLVDTLEEFNDDPRFKFMLRPIAHLGGPLDHTIKLPTKEEFEEASLYAKKLKRLESFFTLKDEDLPMCYASSPRSLVIRSDGTLAKCTVKLDSEVNKIGYLDEDGVPIIDAKKMMFWTRGHLTGRPVELSCPASE